MNIPLGNESGEGLNERDSIKLDFIQYIEGKLFELKNIEDKITLPLYLGGGEKIWKVVIEKTKNGYKVIVCSSNTTKIDSMPFSSIQPGILI